jgi:hypothetical protein
MMFRPKPRTVAGAELPVALPNRLVPEPAVFGGGRVKPGLGDFLLQRLGFGLDHRGMPLWKLLVITEVDPDRRPLENRIAGGFIHPLGVLQQLLPQFGGTSDRLRHGRALYDGICIRPSQWIVCLRGRTIPLS